MGGASGKRWRMSARACSKKVASHGVAVVHLPLAQVGHKLLKADVVHRIGVHQAGEDGGACGDQRSPRPPDMQGGDVAVADGFFAGALERELLHREGVFNEAPGCFFNRLIHCASLYCVVSFGLVFCETSQ